MPKLSRYEAIRVYEKTLEIVKDMPSAEAVVLEKLRNLRPTPHEELERQNRLSLAQYEHECSGDPGPGPLDEPYRSFFLG